MDEKTSIIASRLVNAREEKKLSQADVCRLGEFHKASYSNWERGRRTPSLDDAKKLSNILGISAAYLLNLTTDTNRIKTVPLYSEDILEAPQHLWKALSHIPIQQECFGDIDPDAFAFLVSDHCMSDIVLPGDIILITPCNKPKHGDIVLIKSRSNSLVYLRYYHLSSTSIDEKIIELKSSNNSCPTITIDDETKVSFLGIALNKKKLIL